MFNARMTATEVWEHLGMYGQKVGTVKVSGQHFTDFEYEGNAYTVYRKLGKVLRVVNQTTEQEWN